MNDKKKVGLVKRIAAGVCALMLVVGCMGSEAYYAAKLPSGDESCSKGHALQQDLLLNSLEPIPSDAVLPVSANGYDYCIIFRGVHGSTYYYFVVYTAEPILLDTYSNEYTSSIVCGIWQNPNFSSQEIYYCSVEQSDVWHANAWELWTNTSASNVTFYGTSLQYYYDSGETTYSTYVYRICYSNYDLCCVDTGKVLLYKGFTVTSPGSFNSSLGYLQNILCKELYLEDADYAYDPNYLKKIWTFGNTSTAGSDITDGTYSIRHYQQITVRDTDIKDPVVKEYDMILMNEFPAASLRYEYMSKDYTSRLESESGFEPLGFWETSILGQFVFIRNYFQLVRTNEDGSVEYGGLVKIDLKGSPAANDLNAEHETTTVTPEGVVDQDGYVGGNMDYIQGSGSDYGQAENNADKEYEKENSSSGGSKDLAAQVENLIAVVMAVPRLIAELFSFLPPWCLDFVGVAFTISIGILVYKLAN